MSKTKGLITEWNLEDLFDESDVEEAERQRKAWLEAAESFASKWKGRQDYLENPEVLKEALDDYEDFNSKFGLVSNEYYYYWLKNRQDQSDPDIKAKFAKVKDLAIQIINKLRFFELSISEISEEKRKKFVNSEYLKEYKHFIEKIFRSSRYKLSEKEEEIMTLKRKTAYENWMKMTSDFISRAEKEVLIENGEKSIKGFSQIIDLFIHPNKEVRDSAAKAFNEILKDNLDVAEVELNSVLDNKKVNDKIRGYELADDSVYLKDDVEREIVDALTNAVSEKVYLSQRFYEIKAKLFGFDKLAYHERGLNYGDTNKEYSYEESVELIGKVFSHLDKEFLEIFNKMIKNGRVDVYPKKGKSAGAFCVFFQKYQPTYVLLNHSGDLRNVKTFAHEMGHAINSEMMKKKENALNYEHPLSTAEVASTFMEGFVFEELLKEADEEMRLSLLVKQLGDDIATITRQIYAHLLQQDLHREYRTRGYLSKKEIGEIFSKRMEEYMGDFVEQSEGSENWWVYWEHLRKYFYNYQYAFGLLISKAMQRKVRENPKFIEKVKVFLSTGSSKSPKNIFMEMGIDITKKEFWLEGLQEMEDTLNEIESLAKKLGKI